MMLMNLDSTTNTYDTTTNNVKNIHNHENNIVNTHETLNGMMIEGSQFKIKGNDNYGVQSFKL